MPGQNLVVVPLSAFAPRPTHISLSRLALNVGAMLIFGLIVASLVTRLVDEGLAAA